QHARLRHLLAEEGVVQRRLARARRPRDDDDRRGRQLTQPRQQVLVELRDETAARRLRLVGAVDRERELDVGDVAAQVARDVVDRDAELLGRLRGPPRARRPAGRGGARVARGGVWSSHWFIVTSAGGPAKRTRRAVENRPTCTSVTRPSTSRARPPPTTMGARLDSSMDRATAF